MASNAQAMLWISGTLSIEHPKGNLAAGELELNEIERAVL